MPGSSRSPDILVTGFGRFPHVRSNPTALLAAAVAQRLARSGLAADALVLETSYAGGLPALRRHLSVAPPRAVLMLGLAARARFIRVELFARGHSSRLHVDATGAVSTARHPGRMPARATANCGGALAALRRHGLRARLSPSAGRYLCDASYALALGMSGPETPVLFIHVPWLRPKPGSMRRDRVAVFRPAGPALVSALATIGASMVRAAR